jgi:CRP-like cAMP-binding protein
MASALVDSAITIVQNCKLVELLKREPELASALVAGMARRQTELQTLVQHLMVRNAGVRLASTLLDLGNALGKPHAAESVVITSWYSHQELASMAGINRVTVTRKLRDLCRLGYVEKHGRRQLVIYPNRLRRYIHEQVD